MDGQTDDRQNVFRSGELKTANATALSIFFSRMRNIEELNGNIYAKETLI